MKEFRKREYLSICKLLKIEAIRELEYHSYVKI